MLDVQVKSIDSGPVLSWIHVHSDLLRKLLMLPENRVASISLVQSSTGGSSNRTDNVLALDVIPFRESFD